MTKLKENINQTLVNMLKKNSDVTNSLSGYGSGRMMPFLSDIQIRPDLDLKKRSGSGSGRNLIKKKKRSGSGSGRILILKKGPGPGPVPAGF